MRRWLGIVILLTGCGGAPTSPSVTPAPRPSPAPTPTPAPAPPPSFTGTVTDTVTGAPISGYAAVLVGSRVTVSAPGYLTRETSNGNVDLIKNAAPFDLTFYRTFVRDTLDHPAGVEPLRRQRQSFRIYIRTVNEAGTGINATTLSIVRQALTPALVDAFSGGRVALLGVESGTETRIGVAGWVTVRWPALGADRCGQGFVGGDEIDLKDDPTLCGYPWLGKGGGTSPGTVKHELGHVMGFFHTDSLNDVMCERNFDYDNNPSDRERYHAAIAYKRPIGNRDIDVDAVGTSSVSRVVID